MQANSIQVASLFRACTLAQRGKPVVRNAYQKYYVDLGFERRGLFETLEEKLHPETVLYPGSSIHITPSFVFQNVTYVDPSTQAHKFFADLGSVTSFVESHRKSRKPAFLQYLPEDIRSCNSLPRNYYDLVFTSYSGPIGIHCWQYVKEDGCYVSNNHEGDLAALSANTAATFLGFFSAAKGRYAFTETTDTAAISAPQQSYQGLRDGAIVYLENEKFNLWKKARSN